MDSLPHWIVYALGFLAVNLLILPGLFWLTTAISRRLSRQRVGLRQLFIDYAYTLVPMGLAAWIAFSLGFVLINGSYALRVMSDPFGWGWDLFGTANIAWTPFWPEVIPFLQVGVLIGGLLFAINTTYKITRQHVRLHEAALVATLPTTGFLAAVTAGFLWLYLG